ncbi:MAG: hypothetical protein IPO24_15485 [Bacteroidetes bacterium]|nr:hypothetical protein [Bacteroidota bacterium]
MVQIIFHLLIYLQAETASNSIKPLNEDGVVDFDNGKIVFVSLVHPPPEILLIHLKQQ